MKTEIAKWLNEDKSFEAAVKLYHKHGKNLSFKTVLNRQGKNASTEGVLHDELMKMSGIPSKDFFNKLKQPAKKMELPEISPTPTVVSSKPIAIPIRALKFVRLREEFPFLIEKDCPNELKILVADMISSYDEFKKNHEALFTAKDELEFLSAAEGSVEEYLNNRTIWEELNYYKENKTILGKHPLMKNKDAFSPLREMTTDQLYTRKSNLENGIIKIKAQIKKKDKPELLDKRTENLSAKEAELLEIKKILNIA